MAYYSIITVCIFPCFSVLYTSPIFFILCYVKNTGTRINLYQCCLQFPYGVSCRFVHHFVPLPGFPVVYFVRGISPDTYNYRLSAVICQPPNKTKKSSKIVLFLFLFYWSPQRYRFSLLSGGFFHFFRLRESCIITNIIRIDNPPKRTTRRNVGFSDLFVWNCRLYHLSFFLLEYRRFFYVICSLLRPPNTSKSPTVCNAVTAGQVSRCSFCSSRFNGFFGLLPRLMMRIWFYALTNRCYLSPSIRQELQ